MYSRWTVTDFGATATIFLFGMAHKELYKESEGSVMIVDKAKYSKDNGAGSGGGAPYGGRPGFTLTVDKVWD